MVIQNPAKSSKVEMSVPANAPRLIDWYEYPQYFDMVFRDETAMEVAFFEKAFRTYASGSVSRVYEPGAGSGRLVAAMAAAGYSVVGLDLHPAMVRYMRHRLKRRKLAGTLVQGDMSEFVCVPPVDAAFCTFNTFRHLTTAASAERHLRSVAQGLRRGGIYLLGFHCLPNDVDPECTERWTAKHGGTTVSVTLRVLSSDRRARIESMRASVKATLADGRIRRLRSDFPLRMYNPMQIKDLFARVDDVLELVAVHDFDYDIATTRRIDNDLEDALFVLRRK